MRHSGWRCINRRFAATVEKASRTDAMTSADDSRPDESLLDSVLDEYFRRLDRGESVDREQLLEQYPHLAAQLSNFFETQDLPRPSQSAPSPTFLRYFGDYELLKEIGRGGMGVVYLARQTSLKRLVAVKMILAAELADQGEIDRFYFEARTAASLRHPNIVAIYEVGEQDGQHFFSMDYVAGTNLAALVRRNPLPPNAAAAYVQKIALAIQYAHNHGVLHRDLKPSNVLLDSEDEPHITDFGLARPLESGTGLTATDQIVGTPSYMPPEQALGKRVTVATDVYSIGAILYELLTGRPPHQAQSHFATIDLVLHTEPVAPCSLNPRLPRDLETVCLKCLSKDPLHRYTSAQDLADDLGRYLRHEPTRARPAGPLEKAIRWYRRNPVLGLASSLAAIATVSLLVLATLFAVNERRHSQSLTKSLAATDDALRQSQHRLSESELDKGLSYCQRGQIARGLLWLSRSLQTAPESSTELQEAIRLNLAAWEDELAPLAEIIHKEGSVTSIVYSPSRQPFIATDDGLRMVDPKSPVWKGALRQPLALSKDGQILIALGTGMPPSLKWWEGDAEPQPLMENQHRVFAAAFDKQQRILLAGMGRGGVSVWEGVTGEPVGTPCPSKDITRAALSSDGEQLLTCTKDRVARLWAISSGEAIGPPLQHQDRIIQVAISPGGNVAATADAAGAIQVWDADTGESLAAPFNLGAEVRGLQFTGDGQNLLCAGIYKLKLWRWKSGDQLDLPADSIAYASESMISSDGEVVVAARPLNEVHVLSLANGKVHREQVLEHGNQVRQVAVSADGQWLAAGGDDQVVKVWRAPRGRSLGNLLSHPATSKEGDRIVSAQFSPDGKRLFTLSWEGTVRVWDAETGALLKDLLQNRFGGGTLVISPDGKLGFAGSDWATAADFVSGWLFQTDDGSQVGKSFSQKDGTVAAAFSPDGKRIITASRDGTAMIADTTTGVPLHKPLSHPGNPEVSHITVVAFTPDGKVALTGGEDGSLRCWNVETATPVHDPLAHGGSVLSATFSHDAKLLVTTSRDKTARIWKLPGFEPASPPLLHGDAVNDAAFHPSGKILATACSDGTVRFWHVESGKAVGEPLSHSGFVGSLEFVAGGEMLLASSKDKARLWHVATRRPVGPGYQQSGHQSGISYGHQASRFVTLGEHGAQLWPVASRREGNATAITQRIESQTGLRLDDNGGITHTIAR